MNNQNFQDFDSFQLLHGDCLSLMEMLPDQSVDLILCDLPYGTTRNAWDTVLPFEDLWREYTRLCRGAIVLTASQPFTSALVMSNPRMFKYAWVWEKSLKTNFLNAKRQPLRAHEDVLVFYAQQPTYNPQGLRPGKISGGNRLTGSYGEWKPKGAEQEETGYPASILKIPNPNQGNVHPTQKPVALMDYLIRTYTSPGDVVLDNCMGSGTTGVAAISSGRRFIGVEKAPEYFELAQRRIEIAYLLS